MKKEFRAILLHPLYLLLWSIVFLFGFLILLIFELQLTGFLSLIFAGALFIVSLAKMLQSFIHFITDKKSKLQWWKKLVLVLLPLLFLSLGSLFVFAIGSV